ncbi:MAG: FecR family protein, partial [Prevotella sp.]
MEDKEYIHEEVAIRDYLLRKTTKAPDVRGELAAFMSEHDRRPRGRKVRLWTAIAAAAAVVIAAVFLVTLSDGDEDAKAARSIIAYKADSGIGKDMTLQCGDAAPYAVTQKALASSMRSNSHYINNKVKDDNAEVRTFSLRTPAGMTANVTLADGTKVWLNAGSRLIYPECFAGNERRVKVEGEAYFDVAKDAVHPFIVVAAGTETRVVGTEFNVRARHGKPVHVTLVEGSVMLSAEGKSISMHPGEDVEVSKGGKMRVSSPDLEIFTAWKNGEFYFDNMTLAEIAVEIGVWYNVSVIFNSPAKMSTRLFFAADRNASIDEILRLLNSLDKAKIS